jgi:hypothetical protein
MKILRASAGMLAIALLAGCTAAAASQSHRQVHSRAFGRVTGRFFLEGGPLGPGGQQPGKRPIGGTVTFTAAGHRPFSVRVSSSGGFTVHLPPGRYSVSGRSPRVVEVSGGTRRVLPCSQPLRVTVSAGHAASIAVTCIVP